MKGLEPKICGLECSRGLCAHVRVYMYLNKYIERDMCVYAHDSRLKV